MLIPKEINVLVQRKSVSVVKTVMKRNYASLQTV